MIAQTKLAGLGISLVLLAGGAFGVSHLIKQVRQAEQEKLSGEVQKLLGVIEVKKQEYERLQATFIGVMDTVKELRALYKEKEAAVEAAPLPSLTVGSSISLPMLNQIETHSNAQTAALRTCSQLVLTQDTALRLSAEKERALLETLQTHEGLNATQDARIKNLGKQLADETRAKAWWRGGALVAAGAAIISVLKH